MKRLLLLLVLVLGLPVTALGAEWAVSFPVGSPFPSVQALDQSGQIWSNEAFSGDNGFLFLFNRSVVW
ncbi:MAG: hypothetical protein ABGY96_24020 [bacterium]|nr:hypothetical protein [Gammaproteobacteria bacterium]HIL95901.1 hypothetical protein [Pseudomonadales bacterium]